MSSKGSLDEETAFFEEHRLEWLAEHPGEFALVKGSQLLGFFATTSEAFEAGLKCIGYQDMLIKEVLEKDPIVRLRYTIV